MRRMKESCGVLTLIALSFAPWGQSHKAEGSEAKRSAETGIRPSPEMERLLNAFVGKWTVKETFEVSVSKRGKTREGTATFRAGPGFSLIEGPVHAGSKDSFQALASVRILQPPGRRTSAAQVSDHRDCAGCAARPCREGRQKPQAEKQRGQVSRKMRNDHGQCRDLRIPFVDRIPEAKRPRCNGKRPLDDGFMRAE
jgi:hypothetical protein